MIMQNILVLLLALIPASGDDFDISGKWVRIGQMGPIALEFKADGMVEGDFGNDKTIEISSVYTQKGDMVIFNDREGAACPEPGKYRIYSSEYYISLDLVEDNCAGRIRSTMGFWVRPEFEELLSKLTEDIAGSAEAEAYLNRGRMYMAIGKPDLARKDLDEYIKQNPSDARVFVNRAGTRMSVDLQGVVDDCNKAINLEPDNRNAYFLRGLASYGLGRKEEACTDFYKAIELGFTILKEAEYEKCSEFWESIN